MRFEFDPASLSRTVPSPEPHSRQAQVLRDDEQSVAVVAQWKEEMRSMVIGQIDGRVWAAIVTHRLGAIRIISVRRARPQEVALYEA